MDSKEYTLWATCWNRAMWGNQYELDQAEVAMVAQARTEAKGTGKGTMVGKGRRHWSSAMVHNNYYRPYPFSMGWNKWLFAGKSCVISSMLLVRKFRPTISRPTRASRQTHREMLLPVSPKARRVMAKAPRAEGLASELLQ